MADVFNFENYRVLYTCSCILIQCMDTVFHGITNLITEVLYVLLSVTTVMVVSALSTLVTGLAMV